MEILPQVNAGDRVSYWLSSEVFVECSDSGSAVPDVILLKAVKRPILDVVTLNVLKITCVGK